MSDKPQGERPIRLPNVRLGAMPDLMSMPSLDVMGAFKMPEVNSAIARWNAQAAALDKLVSSSAMASAMAALAEPSASLIKLSEALTASIPKIPKLFDDDFLTRLLSSEARFKPSNYAGLTDAEELSLLKASFRCVFGTYNAIPESVVRAIAAVESPKDQDVDAVLIDASQAVLETCKAALTDVADDAERVAIEREHARLSLRATEAYAAGHYAPAQALATTTWDSCLASRWGGNKTQNAMKHDIGTPDVDGTETFLHLYLKASHVPALKALRTKRLDKKYSRDGTVHHASEKQYTDLNALKAITVGTGVLSFEWA